ncbi:MAG: VWA domain-containing protein, partial [Pseudomonadota bacterium]
MQQNLPYRLADNLRSFDRSERGSLTIFSLFLFILILMIAGMAVDMVRHEHERVALQNAIDTGVVAASSLSQDGLSEADTIALVEEYVQLAGYDPSMVTVTPDFGEVGGVTVSRSVTASVDFQMDTIFMNLMGIDTLSGAVGTTAIEGSQVLEIVLVLDISGSMRGDKLAELKTAAKNFVTFVIDANGPERVSISIVPYNGQVYMDDELHQRLSQGGFDVSLENDLVTLTDTPLYPGEVTAYRTLNPASRCARFRDADYEDREIAVGGNIEGSAWHSNRNTGTNQPNGHQYWCGSDNLGTGTENTLRADGTLKPGTEVENQRIMLYENRVDRLHAHIDSFAAAGWTAIDYGMNWGVGLLDPSFEPIIADMVSDGLLPASADNHPVAYSDGSVKKFIVLMTDGINTRHRDLAD